MAFSFLSAVLDWLLGVKWKLWAICLAGGTVALAGAYFLGRHDQAQACHEAELRVEIASLKRDLAVAKDAETAAEKARQELEADAERMKQEIDGYAEELSKRPDPGCNLTQPDIDRLHKLGR